MSSHGGGRLLSGGDKCMSTIAAGQNRKNTPKSCEERNGVSTNEGRKQVTKRSTHARPGMHMQQCPAVPHDHWYDTRVLPYNCLHPMAFVLSTRPCFFATGKGTLLLPSFSRVTLRVLALLGQVTWTRTLLQGKSVGVWV